MCRLHFFHVFTSAFCWAGLKWLFLRIFKESSRLENFFDDIFYPYLSIPVIIIIFIFVLIFIFKCLSLCFPMGISGSFFIALSFLSPQLLKVSRYPFVGVKQKISAALDTIPPSVHETIWFAGVMLFSKDMSNIARSAKWFLDHRKSPRACL